MTDLAQAALLWLAGNLDAWRTPAIAGLTLGLLGLAYLAHALWTLDG